MWNRKNAEALINYMIYINLAKDRKQYVPQAHKRDVPVLRGNVVIAAAAEDDAEAEARKKMDQLD